ncbi:helix-turn-helix domain-containing protein [Kitasatospora sp. NPDC127067]|uniref:helix-turn-helix domain-containing protein n=1 Tax=Kitasatospora sp. NPDC127067 TaxID=3347126 RepID=UPI003649C118
MPRVSRAEAERSRRRVIDHTARLIREKGPDQVSVPEAMAAAGLTHGGFYRHFASKDDLLAQALAAAFTERREAMERLADRPGDQPAGRPGDQPAGRPGDRPADDRTPRAEFLDRYLSEPHRDHPGHGCAAAALAADAARTEPGSPLRTAYTAGLHELVDALAALPEGAGRQETLADLSTMVGALLLARASDDTALSEEFLTAARHRLAGGDWADGGGDGAPRTA